MNSVHFACFQCRKAFKQPESSDWDTSVLERPFSCPECKQPMTRLGRYFKAPRKQATREWLKVELLYYFGERFSEGNTGLTKRCPTLPATLVYLTETGHPAERVRHVLEEIRTKRAEETPRE